MTVWFSAKISARIPGCAVLAHDLQLLRRIRGGIGRALLTSASAEAISGKPCPWDPPCALDVFFREQGRIRAHGIPKPFVLESDRCGQDLVVTMTLFGLAADWGAAAAHALVTTLQHGIDWRSQRSDVFIPRVSVGKVTVRRSGTLGRVPVCPHAVLEFLTPMNAEGDDPTDRPGTIFARLARRVEGLALWHDVAVEENWARLGVAWNAASYDARFLQPGHARRQSGRGHQRFDVPTVAGTLWIGNLSSELWSLLALGSETHVGKGASEGFGRYILA